MSVPAAILLLLLATGASWLLTRRLRRFAASRSMLDVPNERSSHTVPTPRGGGAAIALVTLVGVAVLGVAGVLEPRVAVALVGGGAAVALVGWRDDRGHVSAAARAAVHLSASAWALWWLGGLPHLTFGAAPVALGWWGWVIGVLSITWCINFYNFMDGIDGIAGAEAVMVGAVAGGLLFAGGAPGLAMTAWLVASAAAGFLPSNWSPARIFMGDVGSGLLGFLFGALAVAAERARALPLPLFALLLGVFVVDATITLVRRVLRGERWYIAHRSHAYQRAAQHGWSHRLVTSAVLALDVGLGLLVWYAVSHPVHAAVTLALGIAGLVAVYAIVERARPMTRPPTPVAKNS